MKTVLHVLFCSGFALLHASCSEKLSSNSKAGASQRSYDNKKEESLSERRRGSSSIDGKRQEQAVFVSSQAALPINCDAPAELSFKLSEGLSAGNVFLLSRFATIGSAALPFDAKTLPNWLSRLSFSDVKLLESTQHGVQGFVSRSARMNLVVFRGTHSFEGVVTDSKYLIETALTNGLPGGVHQGFAAGYANVSAQLVGFLEAEQQKSRPTFFVGHSLGGALATLAFLDLHKKGINAAGLVTFGQPRVGNASFAAEAEKILSGKEKRFVHRDDLVPHLPPTSDNAQLALGAVLAPGTRDATLAFLSGLSTLTGMTFVKANFAHIGTPHMLGGGEFAKARFESDASWDKSYWVSNSESIRDTVDNLPSARNSSFVTDHAVEGYLCELLKTLPK